MTLVLMVNASCYANGVKYLKKTCINLRIVESLHYGLAVLFLNFDTVGHTYINASSINYTSHKTATRRCPNIFSRAP